MAVLAMALSHKRFIDRVIGHSWHIAEHLIKALVFRELSTTEWLGQAENALNDAFNTPTENRLKPSDLANILESVKITDDWCKRHLASLVEDWLDNNKTLTMSEAHIAEVTEDVNAIMTEQIELVNIALKANTKRLYSVGNLTKSSYTKELIRDYELRPSFMARSLTKALERNIKRGIISD